MKTNIICAMAVATIGSMFLVAVAFAHNESASQITHEQEMALGNALLAKVQSGERSCASLSDDDFILLGSHFMDVALGDAHDAIEAKLGTVLTSDAAMDSFHVSMGKNGVHCDATSLGTLGTTPMGNTTISTLGAENLAVKTLLWIFALYGVFSLVKRLMVKKGVAPSV